MYQILTPEIYFELPLYSLLQYNFAEFGGKTTKRFWIHRDQVKIRNFEEMSCDSIIVVDTNPVDVTVGLSDTISEFPVCRIFSDKHYLRNKFFFV